MRSYPGRGRVLVLGLSPEVNRSVVEPLVKNGVDAQGFTRPEEASSNFDARDFELIVFGRGVLGPLSDRLKREFATQNPDIRFVDAIAPVAVEQTLAALAHDPRAPLFVTDLAVLQEDAAIRVTATVLAPCHLTLTLFRVVDEALTSEQLSNARFDPGPFLWTGAASGFRGVNSLLVTADGTEYHLYPFVSGG